MKQKAIYFDMDGTLANLYNVENWLQDLQAEEVRPYREAAAMVNMQQLGVLINMLQAAGYKVGIVSWLSKAGTPDYNRRVTRTKKMWLNYHLHNVQFDEICIVPYGTPKSTVVNYPDGILFDDEARNRTEWAGTAFDVNDIINTLVSLL